ncbi:MAG: four helix bundle protein [Erysipelotrichaceae bacterium]|nr:four helix bundle protein [Erysipelotrichaceae bacterium]
MDNKEGKYKLYNTYDDLVYYVYNIISKYPESEKQSLVVDIKTNLIEGMKLVILIFKSYNYQDRLKYLNLLDANIKMSCFFIRLSYRKKYINKRNYYTWSKKITNLNNLVGEYIKICLKR